MENLKTKIFLETVRTADLIKIQIKGENIPDKFLGLAFHIKIDGSIWGLEKYETGQVFAVNAEKPIILVSQKNNEIIFGLTKKAQDASKIPDGVLAVFYLKNVDNQPFEISFHDTHLSILDGVRRDIQDVIWEGGNVAQAVTETQQLVQLQDDLFKPLDASQNVQILQLYEFLFIVLILIFCACVGYYIYYRRRYWDRK